MTSALIGHTGFVGGNLSRQSKFDEFFNSKNIGSIRGREFECVVCAGVRAEKWKANQHPEDDLSGIQSLVESLETIKTKRMILISTVDIYPTPIDVDEDDVPELEAMHSYGRHRFQLEERCAQLFPTMVVRLPALFGKGLKKNAIFDLLCNHRVEFIHCDGQFQFYDLEWLWADIQVALQHGLDLVNFATEPVSIQELARESFSREFDNRPEGASASRYDFKTKFASLFGGANGYLRSKPEVIEALRKFKIACDADPLGERES